MFRGDEDMLFRRVKKCYSFQNWSDTKLAEERAAETCIWIETFWCLNKNAGSE
jgi:hypothetical protein